MEDLQSNKNTTIGLGLAALGRPEYINTAAKPDVPKTVEDFKQNAFEVLDYAYNNGIRYFDTAPSYGNGETFLLAWNERRKHRDIVLGTKWGYTYVADWQSGYEGPHEIKEHSLSKLEEQWMESKKLLPSLAIYQVHSATLQSGILENENVLIKLHEIKQEYGLKIGITTSGAQQKEVLRLAQGVVVEKEELFDAYQVTFNILEQDALPVLQEATRMKKTVIIKEALANGRLFFNEHYIHYEKLYTTLRKLALYYKVGVDAIALRYCMDRLHPDIVLSGASGQDQLEENLKAYAFQLEDRHIEELEQFQVESEAYWEERSKMEWN